MVGTVDVEREDRGKSAPGLFFPQVPVTLRAWVISMMSTSQLVTPCDWRNQNSQYVSMARIAAGTQSSRARASAGATVIVVLVVVVGVGKCTVDNRANKHPVATSNKSVTSTIATRLLGGPAQQT